MALAEFLKDPAHAPVASPAAKPVDPAAKLRKQVFLEFGAMVALGLLLAGWYVAYRVASGRPATRAAVPAQIKFSPPPVSQPPKVVAQPPPAASIPSNPPPAESKPAPPAAEVITKSEPLPPPHTESKLPVAEPIAKSAPPPLAHETKSATLPVTAAKVPVLTEPVLPKAVLSQPEPVSQPVKRKETTAQQPFKRRDLTPRAGEKYLQIAAYGPRSLDAYLKTLEKQGMHPLVGPGPAENIYRILIGPLPNAEALEQTRHLIQSLGIEPILRSY